MNDPVVARPAAGAASVVAGAPARGPVHDLGPLPAGRRMRTVDERLVQSQLAFIFDLARDVERWPELLAHYRSVRFQERDGHGGGLVDMSAHRPFGTMAWPTWWRSLMQVVDKRTDLGPPGEEQGELGPAIRFRHVGGITTGMEVEWSFQRRAGDNSGTLVRIVHVWDGPAWPVVGPIAATRVIGPVFVHGIASRTLAGLADVAERAARAAGPAARPSARGGIGGMGVAT
jgi:hypothetical protein